MSDLARSLRRRPTDAERRLWRALRNRGLCGCKFRRQHPIVRYVADFVCLEHRVVAEVDGGQHAASIPLDTLRTRALAAQGFKVLRFWNHEVLTARPIQLALPGTNPRAYLRDFADNTDFAGLLVVGVAPDIFFTDWPGIPVFAGLIQFWKDESPSQRFGHRVWLELQRQLAFLDKAYRLGPLIDRAVPVADREGVRGPIRDVWKIGEVFGDRQYFLWHRIETDERLREHARWVWGPFDGAALDEAVIARVIDEARQDVDKIRARGGQVVFIRSPSAGLYYEHEERAGPRARTWEPLLEKTGAFCIHFADHAEMRDLEVPEWSHLSRESATRFTRAYVGVLAHEMPWLRLPQSAEPPT